MIGLGHLQEIRDRIALGWRRTLIGARAYRFAGEEANHAEQAQETRVSLGLMAAAAQEGDADHRIQRWQTEATLNARRQVLQLKRKRLGLTEIELGELESIKNQLDELAAPASPETLGERRMADFGPVTRQGLFGAPVAATGLLGLLGGLRFWHILAAGWAATMLGLGVQTARVNNLKETNRDLRGELAQTQRSLVEAQTQVQALANSVSQADAQTRTTAENIERERARRLRAEREARRIRDAMDQAVAGGPIDYGFGGVRDAGETEAPASDSGAAGRNPG